ncbi:MAG: hypothetical protein ACEPOW_04225 [Bacteroidales bacterium]
MEIKHVFSIPRFKQLLKWQFMFSWKRNLIEFLAMLILVMVCGITVYVPTTKVPKFQFGSMAILYIILYNIIGLFFIGSCFPMLRSKVNSMQFLMMPASIFEKYIGQVLSRVILFVFLFPFVFYIGLNMSGILIHTFFGDLANFRAYPFLSAYRGFVMSSDFMGTNIMFVNTLILPVFFGSFAFFGSVYFQTKATIKTLISLAAFFISGILFVKILGFILSIDEYHFYDPSHFPGISKDTIGVYSAFGLFFFIVITIGIFFTASYFRLKEKEV